MPFQKNRCIALSFTEPRNPTVQRLKRHTHAPGNYNQQGFKALEWETKKAQKTNKTKSTDQKRDFCAINRPPQRVKIIPPTRGASFLFWIPPVCGIKGSFPRIKGSFRRLISFQIMLASPCWWGLKDWRTLCPRCLSLFTAQLLTRHAGRPLTNCCWGEGWRRQKKASNNLDSCWLSNKLLCYTRGNTPCLRRDSMAGKSEGSHRNTQHYAVLISNAPDNCKLLEKGNTSFYFEKRKE